MSKALVALNAICMVIMVYNQHYTIAALNLAAILINLKVED